MPKEPPARPATRRLPIGTLIFVGVLVVFWAVQGAMDVYRARQHDFLNIYTGASLAREGRFAELHDQQAQLAKEQELLPETSELIPFVRPAFYAALLAPLSLIPYETALWCWLLLQFLLLVGCWLWAARKFGSDALIFGGLYFPTAHGISSGQDSSIMLLILIGAYALAERGRPFWSGAVLGLALQKFHLLLLLPVAMLVRRQNRMLLGFGAAAIGEVLLCALLSGIQGMRLYVDLLTAKDIKALSPLPALMINVYAVGENLDVYSPLLSGALVVLTLGVTAIAVWKAPYWRSLAAAVAGSLLIAPHVFRYDASFLLLPLWLVMFVSKSSFSRFAALALLIPIPYFIAIFGKPYGAVPPLAILVFLIALARENYLEVHQERALLGEGAPLAT